MNSPDIKAEPAYRARIVDDTIDVGEVLRFLWSRKLVLLGATVLGLSLSVLYLQMATFKYTAEMKITPTRPTTSSLSESMGGFASLAGIGLSDDKAASPFQLYLESIDRREVAQILSKQREIMTVIFADQWDERTAEWRQPRSPLHVVKAGIKRILGVPVRPWQPPDAAELQIFLSNNVNVDENTKKSIATITFEHKDPVFAAEFLRRVHLAADEILRRRALLRSSEYISYLETKLESVSIAEHRQALVQTLSHQEQMRMMASANVPFAAEPLGDAVSSVKPTSPIPLIVLVLGFLAGGFVGVLGAYAMSVYAHRSD